MADAEDIFCDAYNMSGEQGCICAAYSESECCCDAESSTAAPPLELIEARKIITRIANTNMTKEQMRKLAKEYLYPGSVKYKA